MTGDATIRDHQPYVGGPVRKYANAEPVLIRRDKVRCAFGNHRVDFVLRGGVVRAIVGACPERVTDAAERLGEATCLRFINRVRQSLRGQVVDREAAVDFPDSRFWAAFGKATVSNANAKRKQRPNPPYRWTRAEQLRELVAQRMTRETGVPISFTNGTDRVCNAGPKYSRKPTLYTYRRDDAIGLHEWRLLGGTQIKVVVDALAKLSRCAVEHLFSDEMRFDPSGVLNRAVV